METQLSWKSVSKKVLGSFILICSLSQCATVDAMGPRRNPPKAEVKFYVIDPDLKAIKRCIKFDDQSNECDQFDVLYLEDPKKKDILKAFSCVTGEDLNKILQIITACRKW